MNVSRVTERCRFLFVLFTALALLAPGTVLAQATSADLRGLITDSTGTPIEGARVEVLHVPSGTRSTATTGPEGQFFRGGLRVGGPYEITVTADGYEGAQDTGIFLQPGGQDPRRYALTATAELDKVVVTGYAMPEAIALNNGVGSTFTDEDIKNQPAIDRDVIQTLLRDPLAQSDGVGNLSVGGVNPRFNGFSIDGSLQQDDFGLTTGTYATSRSPINLDAVESATLVASDYSVEAQGFTGGLVNVVTKSGGNEFDGTAYYAYKDDGMVGTDYDGGTFDPGVFEEKEYGATLGGPIIRDKLFFFISYDEYENAAPVDFSNFDATNGVQAGFFEATRQAIIDTYGYDPGTRPVVANVPETSERLLVKLDWNINDFHRMSFSYQDTQESDVSVGADEFESAWYDIPLEVEAYNVELFNDWSWNFSTNFRLNYKENTRGQNCRGGPNAGQISLDFFQIEDLEGTPLEGLLTEGGDFVAGCDIFRHANEFSDDRLQLFGSAEYLLGNHVITFGAYWEEYNLFNLFVPRSRGDFVFENYDELVGRVSNVAYANVTSNNAQDGAASWGFDKLALFVGDRWSITRDFELTYGIRYERFSQSDAPEFSQSIFDTYGVDTSSNLDGKDLFLPRIGFLWTPFDGASLSGGIGQFSGGSPQVWVSNAFQVPTFFARDDFTGVDVTQVPQALQDQVATGTAVPIDYIAEDFEIPSDWKASLRWQQNFGMGRLGDDYVFTAQWLYTKTENGFVWRNLAQTRLDEALPTGVAPDGRPIYADLNDLGINNLTELGNIDGAESNVFTLALAKRYDFGLSFDVSYAYTDAEIDSEGTSSRGISNWRGQYTVDRNNPTPRTAPFQIEHAFKFSFAYEARWISDLMTRFDLFGQVFKGDTWGSTFDVSSSNALFGRAGQNESPFDNNPLYVPSPGNDPRVVYASGFDQDAFFDYLAQAGIPTGGIHAPFSETVDTWNNLWNLRIQQEIPGFGGGFGRWVGENRFTVVLDVFNFLNLLNDDWGRIVTGPSFGQANIVRADLVSAEDVALNGVDGATALRGDSPRTTCLQATDCLYRFNTFDDDPTEFTNRPASVYELRLTLRYDF